MKHLLRKMGFLPFLVILLVGCGGSPSITASASSSPSGLALDTAIEQAAARMEEAFDAGTEVALISVSSPSTQFSEYVLTYLESILVNNGKLAIVDRANLDKVRAEQGFQLSGDVSDESAKAIGQMLGAGAIVTGTLVNLGDAYRLTLKAINVETARVAASYPADIANSPRVQTLLASGGGVAGTQTAQRGNTSGNTTAQAPATPAAVTPPAPTYKIGDTGPAGGIIFYDKFSSAGGWRYLESAPAETEQKFPWGDVSAETSPAIGDGKRNTQNIVIKLQEKKIGGAAQYCDDLEYGGYTDWFLPSRDELDLMYRNLKEKGMGEFDSGWYWSSTHFMDDRRWAQQFSDGTQDRNKDGRSNSYSVRAVRQF